MEEVLGDVRAKVASLVKKPERFLTVQPSVFEAAKVVTKALYDLAKVNEQPDDGKPDLRTLPELIIEDFDEEQVWAGVNLQNEVKFPEFCAHIEALSEINPSDEKLNLLLGGCTKRKRPAESKKDKPKKIRFEEDIIENAEEDDHSGSDKQEESEPESLDKDKEESEEENDELDSILNDPDFQHMSDPELDDLPLFDKEVTDDSEDEDKDDDNDLLADDKYGREKKSIDADTKADAYMKDAMKALRSRNSQVEEVEDKFFKLSEMEKFLDMEDARESRRVLREEKGIDGDGDDDNDDIDLFEPDEVDGTGVDANVLYKDYFSDAPNEGQTDYENEQSQSNIPETRLDILNDQDSSSEDDNADLGEVKSTFEEAQMRMKKKIKRMEEEALKEKPWQLTGEIAGPDRPDNSLLQEHLEYDSVAKQAPIITEAVSKRLEDIIVQRIKDKAWDDVERKVKPIEDPYEYKKRIVLDHEKSKLSLAEIYEQEYLEQKSKLEESKKVKGLLDQDENVIPKEVEEIQTDMKKLFAKLDILTHFHYTPKNVTSDVKIIRNMPSIAMEEVAPVAESDANLLAPQEIVNAKKGDLIGKSERSETDKKRERRQKKAKQRKRQKIVDKLNPGLGNKYSKKKMMNDLKKEEKKGNVTAMKESKDKTVKSSTAFFNQLQNEAASLVKEKSKQKSNSKNQVRGTKLKL